MIAFLLAAELVAVLEMRNELPPAQRAEVNAQYVTDVIRARIAQGGYAVITRENIIQLLQAQGKRLEDCEGECEVETGRRLGADLVVTGEVLRFGSALKVNLRMHRTQTGQLVSGAQASAATVDELEPAIASAVERLMPMAKSAVAAPARSSFELNLMAEFAPIGNVNVGNAQGNSNSTPNSTTMGLAAEVGYTAWSAVGLHIGAGVEGNYLPGLDTGNTALRVPAFAGLRLGVGSGGWVLGADYAPALVLNAGNTVFEYVGAQAVVESPGSPRWRIAAFIHVDVASHGNLCAGCRGAPEQAGVALGAGF